MSLFEYAYWLGVYSGAAYQKAQQAKEDNNKLTIDILNGYFKIAGFHNKSFSIKDYLAVLRAMSDAATKQKEDI